MLIILDVDTFVEENEKLNAIIIVHEYINDFVTFDFYAQFVQNFDQIMSLIYTKQTIFAISSNAYIKIFFYFFQILDFEHFIELFFESFNLFEKSSVYIDVVHVNKKKQFFSLNVEKNKNLKAFARNLTF